MTWFFQQNQGQDPTYLFDMMDDDDDDESDDDGEEDMENEAPQYVGWMKCQSVFLGVANHQIIHCVWFKRSQIKSHSNCCESYCSYLLRNWNTCWWFMGEENCTRSFVCGVLISQNPIIPATDLQHFIFTREQFLYLILCVKSSNRYGRSVLYLWDDCPRKYH